MHIHVANSHCLVPGVSGPSLRDLPAFHSLRCDFQKAFKIANSEAFVFLHKPIGSLVLLDLKAAVVLLESLKGFFFHQPVGGFVLCTPIGGLILHTSQ